MSKAKISAVQIEVLQHMAEGHRLLESRHESCWLDKVPGKRGLNQRVHSNTLYALLRRGYIERYATDKTPWWRRDYRITNTGREML